MLYSLEIIKMTNKFKILLFVPRRFLLVSKTFPGFPSLEVQNWLKPCNLTLKRKQFCAPREENPGNVLLTSRLLSTKVLTVFRYICSLIV